MDEIESLLNEGLKDYDFNPTTTTADARVLGFPMPGGAIGPNVHMMVKAGIIHKYSEVLAEFPIVVEAGGAWTSVTPGSQQYWLQAFNNVMYGRWEKIDQGYGKAVLGYFGKTPLPPNPDVIKKASGQLSLPVFTGDPLEAAPNNIEPARKALEERNLPVTDENIFIVLASMVPGKKMELNEGIRLLTGQGKIDIPLKKKDEPKKEEKPKEVFKESIISGPVKSKCIVEENGKIRTFIITSEPITNQTDVIARGASQVTTEVKAAKSEPIYHPFAGSVEVVDILVRQGDTVQQGQTVAHVEAMKAKHHIQSHVSGTVSRINVKIGDEIDSSTPILIVN
jgi:pyruvate carboxylase subunit B